MIHDCHSDTCSSTLGGSFGPRSNSFLCSLSETATDADWLDNGIRLPRHCTRRKETDPVLFIAAFKFYVGYVMCCAVPRCFSSLLARQASAGSGPAVPQPPSPAVLTGDAIDLTDDTAAAVHTAALLSAAPAPNAQARSATSFSCFKFMPDAVSSARSCAQRSLKPRHFFYLTRFEDE